MTSLWSTLFILFCSGVVWTETSFAYQPKEGNVNATAGTYIYKTNFQDNDKGVRSPGLAGLALVVTGDANDKGSLELSMFHMNKLFYREDSGYELVESMRSIQINMGYRWWVGTNLSTSMSLYSSYPMGEPEVIYSNVPIDVFMDTSARDLTEYGIDFAIQYQLLTYDKNYGLVLDGRYSLSLTNKEREKGDQYGVLLGVRFLIQEKGDARPPEGTAK